MVCVTTLNALLQDDNDSSKTLQEVHRLGAEMLVVLIGDSVRVCVHAFVSVGIEATTVAC